jgi:hypothetical protein
MSLYIGRGMKIFMDISLERHVSKSVCVGIIIQTGIDVGKSICIKSITSWRWFWI